MVYNKIIERYNKGCKQLAFLIDPDKFSLEQIPELNTIFQEAKPDILLIGGSLVSVDTTKLIDELKKTLNIPVVLYPGSSIQVCSGVDAMLFLSLISGRNPEFLISHHVAAAPLIKANNIEAISTGYMLVDGGSHTSVQYMSQTQPIPRDKYDIAVATALAGQYLGMKMIYMDAGSGARQAISSEMITLVKSALDVPLIIGGGIRTEDQLLSACKAGADIVVVGNVFEKDLGLLKSFCRTLTNVNK